MHAFTCNIFSISYYVAAQDFTAMSYDYNAREKIDLSEPKIRE